MHDIAFVISKGNMGYFEVMKLPFYIYLSLRKNLYILDLESSPEGIEFLKDQKRLLNKDADLTRIRQLSGYRKAGESK